MEHEVFVPVPAESLRAVLCDPQRVDRALPGFQRDASGGGGRLKVRIGGHTITYRGSVTVTQSADGSFAVTGEGSEARGAGGVKFALTARVAAASGGSAVTFSGTGSGDGRVAELPREAVTSATHRLLNRFAGNLGATGQEPGSDPDENENTSGDAGEDAGEDTREGSGEGPANDTVEGSGEGSVDDTRESSGEGPLDDTREGSGEGPADDTVEGSGSSPVAGPAEGEVEGERAEALAPTEDHSSVFDTEIPPPSLDPDPDLAAGPESDLPAEPVAAHARRTMIGRSAEEVDHAPPRGRYAPVPAPEGVTTSATLRWAAPAAAVALASAIVVGRALRRRR
ncbi:SRPBCC domain-containing protein [Streptomyces endophyticus]|uniref:SRPBCC domain-containing protein n=1 Tax=Streptomyces endophyticus TaxID=714166 RepID=A0ABU6FJ21_9ACTN|nr:SRPBCC domain-containing protein [Streptomyces endophyticus]MEB8344051.1 SRPBCC domain-containing protein [Streptomyces endophyticus]